MAAKLKLVTAEQPGTKPSRKLGRHGAALWRSVMSEYQIVDSGGVEMLTAACQQLDGAEALRERVDRDGEIVRSKAGPREHPALKHELAAFALYEELVDAAKH